MVSCKELCRSHGLRALFLGGALLGLLALPLGLSGCFLIEAQEQMRGHAVNASYAGLAKHSVAIVVYADQATTNEFPAAREELSSFIVGQLHAHVPTAQLVDPREVINWQDDTLNWFGLTEKEVGKHFGVDRVLFLEVLDYSVHQNKGFGDVQGHLRANCKVYEVDTPGTEPAWTGVVDVRYPAERPEDFSEASPDAVRMRTLQKFATKLVDHFYDRREFNSIPSDE